MNPERRTLDRAAQALTAPPPVGTDTVTVDSGLFRELVTLARQACHDRDYWRSQTTRYSESTRDLSWRYTKLRSRVDATEDAAERVRVFLGSFDRLGQNIDHETIMTAVSQLDDETVFAKLRRDDVAALLAAVTSPLEA